MLVREQWTKIVVSLYTICWHPVFGSCPSVGAWVVTSWNRIRAIYTNETCSPIELHDANHKTAFFLAQTDLMPN